jgi:cell division protein FtsB
MANSLKVKNCRSYCVDKNKKKEEVKINCNLFGFLFSQRYLAFVLVVLIGLSGMFYLFQVNKLATMGYAIDENQKKLEKLRQEKRELEIKIAGLKSVYRFENKYEINNMTKPKKISYMEVEIQKPVAMK